MTVPGDFVALISCDYLFALERGGETIGIFCSEKDMSGIRSCNIARGKVTAINYNPGNYFLIKSRYGVGVIKTLYAPLRFFRVGATKEHS